MSFLFEKIRRIDPEAASMLEEEDIRTDLEIQSLTREDLNEFFPGRKEFKRRKAISGIIHEQKSIHVILEELKGFLPHEYLRDALTGNGVLVDYLCEMKKMKTQVENLQTFFDAHISLMEDISKPGPNQELHKGSSSDNSTSDPMELDKNPTDDHQQGAQEPESTTSASGRPEETVKNPTDDHQQGAQVSFCAPKSTTPATGRPVKTVKNQTGPQGTRGTPVPSGPSGWKVHSLSRTDRLLHFGRSIPDTFSNWIPQFSKGGSSSDNSTSGPMELDKNPIDDHQRGTHGTPVLSEPSGEKVHPLSPTDKLYDVRRSIMKYRMVVSRETFGSHQQLMDQIKTTFQGNELQLEECNQDFQIVFIFCPIASRVATDVTAAMDDVKGAGDKPIILVLMHHSYEPRYVTPLRSWPEYPNVELHLNVFFHESRGFLTCQENATAVSEIRTKLLQIHSHNSTSADAQDKSSMTGSYPGGGDNSDNWWS